MEMVATVSSVLAVFAAHIWASLPSIAVTGLAFTGLSLLPRCNAGRPWWRKPDLATDIGYIVLMPGLMHYARIAVLAIGLAVIYGGTSPVSAAGLMEHGFGPLSGLPFWVQTIIYLLGSDLMLYWTHRLFHDLRLWRYHAVHHSSEQLEWISAFRFHPVDYVSHVVVSDCVLLLLGISPGVLVWLVPFSLGMATLAHANLDWTFGPFRAVLASPVYHRWHHTDVGRGGSRNFGSNFPIFDVIFGTFHMPKGELPSDYGVTERDVPGDLAGQWLHPFRPSPSAPVRYPEAAE